MKNTTAILIKLAECGNIKTFFYIPHVNASKLAFTASKLNDNL